MLPAYIFIKFTTKNIFVNIYLLNSNKYLEPIQFYTFGRFARVKSKYNREEYTAFAKIIVKFISIIQFTKIVLIFKSFGVKFSPRRKFNYYKVNQKRVLIYKSLLNANIKIIEFVDDSALPFNGCKQQKIRRKRVKGLQQLHNDLPHKVTSYKL